MLEILADRKAVVIRQSIIGPDSHRAAECEVQSSYSSLINSSLTDSSLIDSSSCNQCCEIDIQQASTFLIDMFQMSTFLCEQPSSYDRRLEIDGVSSFSSETSTSSDGPWL